MGVGWHRARSLGRQSLQIPTGLKDTSLLPLLYLHPDKSQKLQASLFEPRHGHPRQRRGFGGSLLCAKPPGGEKKGRKISWQPRGADTEQEAALPSAPGSSSAAPG